MSLLWGLRSWPLRVRLPLSFFLSLPTDSCRRKSVAGREEGREASSIWKCGQIAFFKSLRCNRTTTFWLHYHFRSFPIFFPDRIILIWLPRMVNGNCEELSFRSWNWLKASVSRLCIYLSIYLTSDWFISSAMNGSAKANKDQGCQKKTDTFLQWKSFSTGIAASRALEIET